MSIQHSKARRFLWIVGVFFFYVSSCSSLAHAKVYQWTDADGKLHFSDEAPQDQQGGVHAGSEPLEMDVQENPFHAFVNQVTLNEKVEPVGKKEGEVARRLNLELVPFAREQRQLGWFYLGADCVSPRSISLLAVQKNHPSMLPDEQKSYRVLAGVLSENGFPVRHFTRETLGKQGIPLEEARRLEVEIKRLEYHVCADEIKNGLRQYDYDELQRYQLRLKGVMLETRWSLLDGKEQLLFTRSVKGYADNLEDGVRYQRESFSDLLKMATRNAARRFLSDQLVRDDLSSGSKPVPRPVEPRPAAELFSTQSKILVGVILILVFLGLLMRIAYWR